MTVNSRKFCCIVSSGLVVHKLQFIPNFKGSGLVYFKVNGGKDMSHKSQKQKVMAIYNKVTRVGVGDALLQLVCLRLFPDLSQQIIATSTF